MRTTRTLTGVILALSLAACTSGTTPAPSPEQSPEPSSEPTATQEPSATPTEAPEPVSVWVGFDGEACSYTGPLVIPDGTPVQFSYAASEGTEPTKLVVVGVEPGTTWETILQDTEEYRASEAPPWAEAGVWYIVVDSGGSAIISIVSEVGTSQRDGYFVGCATAPLYDGGTDRMYPAALIEVGIAS